LYAYYICKRNNQYGNKINNGINNRFYKKPK